MFSAESPLQFYVNHASSPSVTAYGPGLSYGVANKKATFTVFTDDASEGEQNAATRFDFFFFKTCCPLKANISGQKRIQGFALHPF